MAKQNLSSEAKPKQSLSPETRKALEAAQKGVERFSKMAGGISGFCYHVDESREDVYNFSFAVATIAEMLQEDAERISKSLCKCLSSKSFNRGPSGPLEDFKNAYKVLF